tara:strand:- start:300 stop:488 length:189 start_codon:yes stop_codon:yes gene_type:complete
MPIYEYECSKCEHKIEILQDIKEDALTECPVCEEEGLKKLISNSSFRLKGTGWYETDYKEKK